MNIAKFSLLLAGVFAIGSAVAEEANSLANGHFEDGKEHWFMMNHAVVSSDGHESSRGLELRSSDQETVRAETGIASPPQSGVFRIWYRCPDKKISASQLVVAIIPSDATGVEIPNGRKTFVLDRPDNEEWQEFVSEFSLPGDTKTAMFRASLNESDVEGSAKGASFYQIDDIVIASE